MPETLDNQIKELEDWLREHPNATADAVLEIQHRLKELNNQKTNQKNGSENQTTETIR